MNGPPVPHSSGLDIQKKPSWYYPGGLYCALDTQKTLDEANHRGSICRTVFDSEELND